MILLFPLATRQGYKKGNVIQVLQTDLELTQDKFEAKLHQFIHKVP